MFLNEAIQNSFKQTVIKYWEYPSLNLPNRIKVLSKNNCKFIAVLTSQVIVVIKLSSFPSFTSKKEIEMKEILICPTDFNTSVII